MSAHGSVLPARRPERLTARLRHFLPQGRTLPEEVWRRRHRALLILLWAHAVALPLFGVVRGYSVFHSIQEGMIVATLATLALLFHGRNRIAAAFVSLGLITSSALLVHLWGGVIEAHFHFFVMVVLLALYEDWLAFLLAAAYVVIHHGLTGALDPDSVYNHADAVANPWKWAAIHGFFVTGAGIGAVATWRLNEDVRAENREAHRLAVESERRFKGAFENAPIGMALASIAPGEPGRFIQVNRALCRMLDYSRDELLGKSFAEVTHADDVEGSVEEFRRLLTGETPRYEVEKRYVRADGRLVWAHVNVSLVRDEDDRPLYAIGQIQDTTERREAQQQLLHQAYHDSLTGLPNRRRLMEDLEQRIATATRSQPFALVLFDLDGFKAYNDSFGHPAGDALLARLGRRLGTAVADLGQAYRMGGDEFCVLGAVPLEGPESLAKLGTAALTEHGEGFAIGASHGAVIVPTEAADRSEALRRADRRMYAQKGATRTSAGQQATDALLRALIERSPDLGGHVSDVTVLCKAVARELGVGDDEMTPLLQAASLHDIGKIAIPDAILAKPGALDESEWEFMRTHTLIGERIVGAAPALARAARLVRSTHERFDGKGYPDRLAAEQIPFGARVIAVCDAFGAMISDRPYRLSMSREGALSELRRGAGTQFDSDVVEALAEVVAAERDVTAQSVDAPSADAPS